MTTCDLCTKPYTYRRGTGATKETCGVCMTNRHRWHLKWFCVQYKGGACQLCGYNRIMRNLDFHHVDPEGKDFALAGKHCVAWETIRRELDKCVCVCRHCHGEIHEAEDALVWGRADPGILSRVREVFSKWTPDTTVRYSRDAWKDHHPAFKGS